MLNFKKKNYVEYIGMLIIVLIGIAMILPLTYKNDYFLDEAMLANSIFTRNFFRLCATPLDYSQSAQVGYLYIVKFFTLFGGNENFTRISSLIASFITIFLIYRINKDILKVKFPVFATCFASCIGVFIQYSSMLKQYTFDTMCIFLAIYLFGRYIKNKMSLSVLCIFYALLLWFSFAVIFFIAGILIYIVLDRIFLLIKDKSLFKTIIKDNIILLLPLVSVLINLFLWLLPSTNNIGYNENDYWSKLSFPLIPRSLSDIKLIAIMVFNVISSLGGILLPLFVIAVLIFIWNLKKYLHNSGMIALFISFTIILVASYIGKYPISIRLLIFVPMIAMVATYYIIEKFVSKVKNIKMQKLGMILLCAIISVAAINVSFSYFISRDNVFLGHQVSYNVDYINDNIKPDDYVYITAHAIPEYSKQVNYKYYFNKYLPKPVQKDHFIFGSYYKKSAIKIPYSYNFNVQDDLLEDNINAITKYNSVYILTGGGSNVVKELKELIDKLKETGTVEVINEKYHTYLFKYDRLK
ncbi:MAG: glycosyltransferase family 39 protein [Bacillota bacterium]|nr:glycosyltransferase family 39 protein [Bacillota bacterium]